MAKLHAYRVAMEAVHHINDDTPPWDAILESTCTVAGADGATLMMFDGNDNLLLMHQRGVDACAEEEYRAHYHKHDALAEASINSPPGEWWDSIEMQSDNSKRRHPFFVDYLPRHRMGQVSAYIIMRDRNRRAAISFQRQTPRTHAIGDCRQGYLPQLLNALTKKIVEREMTSYLQLELVDTALTRFGEACLCTTPGGLIQRATANAYDFLNEIGMLDLAGQRLVHPQKNVLTGLTNGLASSAASGQATSFSAPISWGKGIRFDIVPAMSTYRLSHEPLLFVRMRRLSAYAASSVAELAVFFSLTPAEARILAALIDGHTPNDIAQSFGIAVCTARNQIASVMRKMRCNRQSELIRLGSLVR